MRRILVTLLIGLALTTVVRAEPVRLAILAGEGERAPGPEVIAQIEVATADENGFALVERAEISRILREQRLTAAALADPVTAVRLGEILSAEMFLFVEGVPNAKPAAHRFQVIEAKTGIALAVDIILESELGAEDSGLRTLLRNAVEKRNVPLGERRYLGVLGIRNEEPGQALDALARTLWMLLTVDLNECPEVILLDREHMRWLTQEGVISDLETSLKLSTVLLDGGLKRGRENGEVIATVLLTPVAGGEPARASISLDSKDIPQARSNLVAAIAEQLKVRPVASPSDPTGEAERFMTQSRVLAVCGEKDAALRAAEAAYALWPDRKTLLWLASYLASEDLGYRDFEKTTEAERLRALRWRQRQLELLIEHFPADFGAYIATKGKMGPLETEYAKACGLGVVAFNSPDANVTLAQEEVAELERKLFDLILQTTKEHPDEMAGPFWRTLENACDRLRLFERDLASKKADALREILLLWRTPPCEARPHQQFFGFNLIQNLYWVSAADAALERKAFAAVFAELTNDHAPMMKLTGHFGLISIGQDKPDSARKILKIVAEELDWTIVDKGGSGWMSNIIGQAITALRGDPKTASEFCERIMGPWMAEGGDTWRVGDCYTLVHAWADAAAAADGKQAGVAVYDRAMTAVRDGMAKWPDYRPSERRTYLAEFEERRARWAPKSPLVVAGDPWNDYSVRALGLNLSSAGSAAITKDERVYIVSNKTSGLNLREITISVHRFPVGGAAQWSTTMSLPVQGPMYFDEVWPVFIDDCLYIGTCGGLIVLDADWKCRLLTENDGLPGTVIGAMAAFQNKLYMGIGRADTQKRAFAVYEPATGDGRVIWSNTALEQDQRRDLAISMILTDNKRKCLWVGGTSTGLWRFDPETEQIEMVARWHFGLGAPYAIHTMAFCDDGLLYTSVMTLALVNLDDFTQTYLAGDADAGPNGRGKQARFGVPKWQVWPAWYDGETLLTGGAEYGGVAPPYPELHRVGQEPVPNRDLKGLRLFEQTPYGLLALDSKGEGYLITKKQREQTAK